jgi:ElaB/YqjD/DUF883 family membrane-anchored ribosome-binding protein
MVETNSTSTASNARRPTKRRQRVADSARAVRDTAQHRADEAVKATAEALDQNPFGALAGAIAFGAVAAAMIPATRRELETLGPWAEHMRDALVEAFDAAKTAGTGELTASGLTLAAASDGVGGIVGKIVKAATVATSAAATSVKQSRKPAVDIGSQQSEPLASAEIPQ